ncbi:MAG TPA: hypothetical protein PLP33_25950 [Leptospiraceae bacterium]|nr:hypothetical protein [Leptospiraceae bacterium]
MVNNITELSLRDIESIIEVATKEWLLRSKDSEKGSVILYDGSVISLLNFKPEHFNPEHCFNILPNINRYNGNTYITFSVGHHSLLCKEIAKMLFGPEAKIEQVCALIHDFPEGIIGDCISPIKYLFPMLLFRLIDQNVTEKMLEAIGIKHLWKEEKVNLVDKLALSIEVHNLNRYYNLDIWKNYIFPIEEVKKIFRDHGSEYSDGLIDDVVNLEPRQVEVRLRNSYNSLMSKIKENK